MTQIFFNHSSRSAFQKVPVFLLKAFSKELKSYRSRRQTLHALSVSLLDIALSAVSDKRFLPALLFIYFFFFLIYISLLKFSRLRNQTRISLRVVLEHSMIKESIFLA